MRDLESLSSMFPTLFNEAFQRNVGIPLEIMEEENKVIVKAEIPGVNKEDIEVSVDDGILRIKAEKKEEKKEKGLSEFIYGKFERQVKLPEVNAENINAEYKDGILKLEIPKEEKKLKRIEIK